MKRHALLLFVVGVIVGGASVFLYLGYYTGIEHNDMSNADVDRPFATSEIFQNLSIVQVGDMIKSQAALGPYFAELCGGNATCGQDISKINHSSKVHEGNVIYSFARMGDNDSDTVDFFVQPSTGIVSFLSQSGLVDEVFIFGSDGKIRDIQDEERTQPANEYGV